MSEIFHPRGVKGLVGDWKERLNVSLFTLSYLSPLNPRASITYSINKMGKSPYHSDQLETYVTNWISMLLPRAFATHKICSYWCPKERENTIIVYSVLVIKFSVKMLEKRDCISNLTLFLGNLGCFYFQIMFKYHAFQKLFSKCFCKLDPTKKHSKQKIFIKQKKMIFFTNQWKKLTLDP